jgi:uncharacterized phage-associated protein
MECFTADIKKFIAGLLYIAKKIEKNGRQPDFYRVFKIMYFADTISLPTYYQTVFGDWHALPHGPVPESLYQVIKGINAGEKNNEFSINDKIIEPYVDPDMDQLSEIDLECIDKSISENVGLSFKELEEKSHTKAWKNTLTGYSMNILDIASDAGASQEVLDFLKEKAINCSPSNFECLC